MRITRLYHPEELICGETTYLHSDSSNHLVRVLRARADTDVILFNGDGFDYHCKTLDEDPRKTGISIGSRIKKDNESCLRTTLVQGLSRQDRMDQTIQKAVELGVNKIIPALCQRSNTRLSREKQNKKLAHWRKIAISACEQSGRSIIPDITEVISLEDIASWQEKDALNIILNPASTASLNDLQYDDQSVVIIIGPEGGLSDTEINELEKKHYSSIQFGPRILRTETAGPAVISALQLLWGDC